MYVDTSCCGAANATANAINKTKNIFISHKHLEWNSKHFAKCRVLFMCELTTILSAEISRGSGIIFGSCIDFDKRYRWELPDLETKRGLKAESVLDQLINMLMTRNETFWISNNLLKPSTSWSTQANIFSFSNVVCISKHRIVAFSLVFRIKTKTINIDYRHK